MRVACSILLFAGKRQMARSSGCLKYVSDLYCFGPLLFIVGSLYKHVSFLHSALFSYSR